MNVSVKVAGQDWLELLGFPPPGHAIWNAALLDATAVRYPGLDLQPWRAACREG